MGQMSERRGAWDERRVLRTKLGLQSGTVYDSIGHIKVCKFRERMKRVYEKRVECFRLCTSSEGRDSDGPPQRRVRNLPLPARPLTYRVLQLLAESATPDPAKRGAGAR